jgi:uncharacterized protein YyaL (SSP411 family)
MLRAIFDISLPNRVLQVVADGQALADGHPATGKSRTGGTATVYVCHGPTCSLPITDAQALRAVLNGAAP